MPEGTSFGPRLLGVADECFYANCTAAAIAQLLERVHGFKMSLNAVLNPREALADSLRKHQSNISWTSFESTPTS